LEEKRAAAGNVTVTASVPTNHQSTQQLQQDDPLSSLQKLKSLLDAELISQEEFDAKKADILSRL